jgi:hypothetical protein
MSDRAWKMSKVARFWAWENHGWIKLTLRPGESVFFHESGETEEGWQSYSCSYTFDGDEVELETHKSSRDCDGPHQETSVVSCALENLRAREPWKRGDVDYEPENGAMLPLWAPKQHWQRDTYAERMGY